MSSVSVVIPCYKYGHFLADAVASVLDDQQGVDVRVLIIDDASPDDSARMAEKIAAADPRVEVAVHEVNRGHIATYNEGLLEWADGDYTVLMSADDRLAPGALRRARDLLDTHPSVGFVYGWPVYFLHGTPLPAARTRLRGWSVWPGREWLERRYRQGTNCITSPEVVVRTSLQKRVGGYDPTMPHTGDLEMWLRMAANADVGHVRGVDQAYYRIHDKNMTTSFNALMDLGQRRLAFETVLERYQDRLPEADRLSSMMRRKLSQEALWAAARAYDLGRTEDTPVDELVAFAFDCWPEADRLPGYQTLRLRQRIGPAAMAHLEPVIVSGFTHKVGGWLQRRSWKWRGY